MDSRDVLVLLPSAHLFVCRFARHDVLLMHDFASCSYLPPPGGAGGGGGGPERVVSLLHTPAHAATIDKEEVRAAAASAFDQLCLVNEVNHAPSSSLCTATLPRPLRTLFVDVASCKWCDIVWSVWSVLNRQWIEYDWSLRVGSSMHAPPTHTIHVLIAPSSSLC